MLIFDYNNPHHKYKEVHDETGGRLKDLSFKYYDCFCGHAGYTIVSTTTRHHNAFNVAQCTKCGTLRINPYLSDEAVEIYYKEIYGPIKRKNMTADQLFTRQSKSADEMYEMISRFALKDSLILDYGSGAGGRMMRLKKEGYANVHLFDYDRKYLEYGISKGFKQHEAGNRYDLITLSHVLEHVNQPVEFLQALASDYLNPNGKIYVEVPMFENHTKLLGDFHLAHKFYFTAPSLAILAKIAGFKALHEEEDVIVITPSAQKQAVPDEDYEDALQVSDDALEAAARRSRTLVRRVVFKNMFAA